MQAHHLAVGEDRLDRGHRRSVILATVQRYDHRGIADVEVHVARRHDLFVAQHAAGRRDQHHLQPRGARIALGMLEDLPIGVVLRRLGQSDAPFADEAGKVVDMAIGMVVEQAVTQPDDTRIAQVLAQPALDIGLGHRRVAIGVEKALLGRHHRAGTVTVDRAAFQHPVAIADLRADRLAEPQPDRVVALQIVFAAPAVEVEVACLFAVQQDRRGVAQPDVAERFNHHLGKGGHAHGGVARFGIGSDQDYLLAPPLGVDGTGEGDDLLARRLQILDPQVGVAREADPHGRMRRPFGGRRGDSRHLATPVTVARLWSRMLRNSSPGSQFGQARLSARSRLSI